MKTHLFPRLAWMGIRKNKKLYLPYILSCVGMVTMTCIIQSISCSPVVSEMHGGHNLSTILSMGLGVTTAFALIFLLYTQSFLVRRRNREFGLFNILGMDKKGITKVIVWESLYVSLFSLGGGLLLGILLSKLCELLLLYIIHAEVSYTFYISREAVGITAILFAGIFFLLLLKSVWQVRRTDPLELMHSENFGEKPPKANWIFAVLGVLVLGVAYTMSVAIRSPLSALFAFLIAVILVIAATYLLFMSGSVALCRLLQRNKKYYYKKNHFVSVSSMAYRMKRNGAGLASICILSTMVLVMLASTASLYFGADDAIRSRFPQQNQISVYLPRLSLLDEAHVGQLRNSFEKQFDIYDVAPQNVTEVSYASITGLMNRKDNVDPDVSRYVNTPVLADNMRSLYFMEVSEYNRIMGTNLSLADDAAMCKPLRCAYTENTFNMNDVHLRIVGTLDDYPEIGNAKVAALPSILFVVSDLRVLEPLETLADYQGDQMLEIDWYYGYDLPENTPDDLAVAVHRAQKACLKDVPFLANRNGYTCSDACLAVERDDFYSTFGGLFFIGMALSIVFIFAMAMIIYYKQISEGYEDRTRFGIMQKVGMTKKDIRRSINSQVLTVFFAPLLCAGLHLCFAFPPIWKILQLFNLQNLRFVLCITAAAFVLFGIFYTVLYKATAGTYFRIVSETED